MKAEGGESLKVSTLDNINPSLGTTMFNFYGILSTLNKLNKDKKIICSPLSHNLPKSRLTWKGKLLPKDLHLCFNKSEVLETSDLFLQNISQCISANCDFIIIALSLRTAFSAHSNYIIINNKQAYRIDPYGHGVAVFRPATIDSIERQLKELFEGYGIVYTPHSELSGFETRGLQTIGEDDNRYQQVISLLGHCNTYVFIYIEEICKYHNNHSNLSGIELFREAINTMISVFLSKPRGYTEREALEYNRKLLDYQQLIYSQLIESKPKYKKETRSQKRKRDEEIVSGRSKLEVPSLDPKRKQLEIIDFDNTSDIFSKLPPEILTIYGIDFDSLYSVDERMWGTFMAKSKAKHKKKSKSKKHKKKKKHTKHKKKKKHTKHKKKKHTKRKKKKKQRRKSKMR